MTNFARQQRGKTFAALGTLSALLLVSAFATLLNRGGMAILGWSRSQLGSAQHEAGFAYIARTFHAELSSHEGPSTAQVWEDGRPLRGPENALHEDIRKIGHGRYSFWHSLLYYSSSDNTDPRTNGRSYEIRYPNIVSLATACIVYSIALITLFGTAWFVIRNQDLPEVVAVGHVASFFSRHPFILPAIILVGVFLITRLPFFVHYPVVGLSNDTGGYSSLADVLRSGGIPHFIMRTPGYPIFIWIVTSLANRWLAVVVVQNLLTLSSSLCLVFAVSLLRPQLALPAAVAMCGFIGSSQVLFYDTFALSDSLYASSIVFSIALLFLALSRSHPVILLASSALMAATILVRPAGMFFIVIYALLLAYMLWNRSPRIALVSFALPLPAVLLGLCAYNHFTIGDFVISPWGEANLVGATALYWEQDPVLPNFVNNALKELPDSYHNVGITPTDLLNLRTSWNADLLFDIYQRSYAALIHSEHWGDGSRFSGGITKMPWSSVYLPNRGFIRQVSFMAIRKHPLLYVKFVWVNILQYGHNIAAHTDIYAAIGNRARIIYVTKDRRYMKSLAKEFTDSTPPGGVLLGPPGSEADVTLAPSVLGRLHSAWESWHSKIFERLFWVWASLGVLVASAWKFIHSGGRHLGAFILCLLGLTAVGACLVVCLVELADQRYSYPTQFIYYLLVALLPLLWICPESRRRQHGLLSRMQ